MTEWFRTPDWDDDARADFEQRLGRARSSRSQYIRIKALSLQRSGLLEEAEALYRRFLVEYPGDFQERMVLEALADVARECGDLEEAERRYRRALAHPGSGRGDSGLMQMSLAEVLFELGRVDEASAELEQARDSQDFVFTVTAFHISFFRFHLVLARIAHALADPAGAAEAAQAALSVVDAPTQYPRHPGVGAVQTDQETIDELIQLSAGGASENP